MGQVALRDLVRFFCVYAKSLLTTAATGIIAVILMEGCNRPVLIPSGHCQPDLFNHSAVQSDLPDIFGFCRAEIRVSVLNRLAQLIEELVTQANVSEVT